MPVKGEKVSDCRGGGPGGVKLRDGSCSEDKRAGASPDREAALVRELGGRAFRNCASRDLAAALVRELGRSIGEEKVGMAAAGWTEVATRVFLLGRLDSSPVATRDRLRDAMMVEVVVLYSF